MPQRSLNSCCVSGAAKTGRAAPSARRNRSCMGKGRDAGGRGGVGGRGRRRAPYLQRGEGTASATPVGPSEINGRAIGRRAVHTLPTPPVMKNPLRCLVLFFAAGLTLAAQPDKRKTTGGLKPPPEKELIYVCLPGTLEGSWDQNGSGIVVLDAANDYAFIKRITTWDIPASRFPEQVAGVTASPVTQMIYVATRGRLAAWDLTTEKKAWENNYDGNCCERPQIAPDGSFMYVGSDLKDYWYVVNPVNGE